jgi:hypothetical protein
MHVTSAGRCENAECVFRHIKAEEAKKECPCHPPPSILVIPQILRPRLLQERPRMQTPARPQAALPRLLRRLLQRRPSLQVWPVRHLILHPLTRCSPKFEMSADEEQRSNVQPFPMSSTIICHACGEQGHKNTQCTKFNRFPQQQGMGGMGRGQPRGGGAAGGGPGRRNFDHIQCRKVSLFIIG